jgi:hypothetical protein
MRRFAQLSRYARGSLASLMASRVAAAKVSTAEGKASEVRTSWFRVAEANGRFDSFGDGHNGDWSDVGWGGFELEVGSLCKLQVWLPAQWLTQHLNGQEKRHWIQCPKSH